MQPDNTLPRVDMPSNRKPDSGARAPKPRGSRPVTVSTAAKPLKLDANQTVTTTSIAQPTKLRGNRIVTTPANAQPKKPKDSRPVATPTAIPPANKPHNQAVTATARQKLPQSTRCHFLEVAGEIRNQIYGYLFDSTTIIEMMPASAAYRILAVHAPARKNPNLYTQAKGTAAKPKPPRRRNAMDKTQKSPARICCSTVLGKHDRINIASTNWKTSVPGAALCLTSKQFYAECTAFLYASASFFFQSPNRVANFLTKTPQVYLDNVTRLQLEHVTYGEPIDPDNIVWKTKHDAKWAAVCAQAAAALPHLQELSIVLDVREVPLRFWPREAWIKPLLSFTTLLSHTRPNPKSGDPEPHLQHVSVKIRSVYLKPDVFEDKKLTQACHALHWEFGKVVQRKILGWDDESAMLEYVELALKPESKHRRFRDYLNFNPPW
ncbi:hypothetical protein H2201_000985 [Coniosporium apollinis]|uniref:DUF7730 domain-containing protein n=1 Tax=Coniosporium apollinis TaxID=61459 RepID=A0ABQ9P421_9PEZI|nr:hypothetical protein H2201_000985 [Coniosporium apollinis]